MPDSPASTVPDTVIDALFVGCVGTLAGDGAASAIDKQAVEDARWLGPDGVAGDTVADRVHHGGRERALNHYPADHYERWRARYPGFEDAFLPGALGENVSTRGLTEADVHVGDVFRLGQAIIQIAQPRQPCWKIGVRTGVAGLARAVAAAGAAGWLYRVIEPGAIRVGDRLARVETAPHGITLARLWSIQAARAPGEDDRRALITLAELPALAPEWRKRLAARARRLADR